jgi:hypothetical protein
MAITVKFRRGSTTESNAFLGEEGELYIDKDKDTVVVHDGVTTGGKPLATESYVNSGLSLKANISSLSVVATSGSYNDLLNKPYFATNVSEFTNDANYANVSYVDSEINDLSTSVNNQLSLKADTSSVNSQITTLSNNVNTQLNLKANSADLAVVAISGSYNDLLNKPTDLATQTYVNTQIANVIDTAPTTLDTLNELAAALGDDPNFATTISNQIGLKANISSLATVATSGSYNDLTNKPSIQPLNANLTTLSTNGFGVNASQVPQYDANAWLTIGANWKVKEVGGVLFFAHNGVNRMKIDSSGNLTVSGDVTAFGTV